MPDAQVRRRVAVDGLSLTIEAGTVFGFLGPNGRERPRRSECSPPSSRRRMATRSSRVMRWVSTTRRFAVRSGSSPSSPAFTTGCLRRQNLRYFARLYDLDPARADAQVERYLHLLELGTVATSPSAHLQGHAPEARDCARSIARADRRIPRRADRGARPEAARTVREFVKGLKAEGRTIFLTTHNLPEADELCDSIGSSSASSSHGVTS